MNEVRVVGNSMEISPIFLTSDSVLEKIVAEMRKVASDNLLDTETVKTITGDPNLTTNYVGEGVINCRGYNEEIGKFTRHVVAGKTGRLLALSFMIYDAVPGAAGRVEQLSIMASDKEELPEDIYGAIAAFFWGDDKAEHIYKNNATKKCTALFLYIPGGFTEDFQKPSSEKYVGESKSPVDIRWSNN